MHEIVPGVFSFSGLGVGRVYLIVDPDGLALVDCGLGWAAPRILAQLRAAGHAPTDVKRILITHAHFDHIGGLPALKAATGAPVIALAAEQPYLTGEARLPRPRPADLSPLNRLLAGLARTDPPARPIPADRLLADGETIAEVLGGLQAIHTQGHTPGHTAFWQPERRLLFCGDALMHLWGLSLPFAMATGCMIDARRSVVRLAALQPDVICFGHGGPLLQGAAPALDAFARRVAPH